MSKIYLKTKFVICAFSLLLWYGCSESPPSELEKQAPEISTPDTLPAPSSHQPDLKQPAKITSPEKQLEKPVITTDTVTPSLYDTIVSPDTSIADTALPLNLPNEGVVARVLDGDTIEMLLDGIHYTIRYTLIDAPETIHPFKPVEPFGKEASELNRKLVEGKQVRLEKDVSEKDNFGRLLRYVYVDSIMINEELIRQGLAKVAAFPPDVKYLGHFLDIERKAQEAKMGIWSIEPLPSPAELPDSITGELFVQEEALQAENSVVITKIFYDGIVPRVESDEYIEIKNKGKEDLDLTGWRINAGKASQEFKFPKGFIIKAGSSCRVYTNEIHPESGGLSFGSKRAIWKNSGDVGLLLDAESHIRSQCKY